MTRKRTHRKNISAPEEITSNNSKELTELVDQLLRLATMPNEANLTKALEHQREIDIVTKKIVELESQMTEKSNSIHNSQVDRTDAATIDKFTRWMIKNGAEINGCSIHVFDNYDLGVKVDTEIPISSLVIAVPRNLMLTVEVAAQSEFHDFLKKDQILSNMANVALSMSLLYLKFKKDQFWKPYFDILPLTYRTVLYFSLEELEEIKGSPTLEVILKQMKSIARQYAYFHKLFHSSNDRVSRLMRKHFTYAEYCWAASTVMTRQNNIPSSDGEETINALIPLWDMCNHINGKISTEYNPQLHRSECIALKDFKPGEQFFIFYGTRTNADFFMHNGFVYDDNIYDGYWLKIGVGRADPLKDKRIELLAKLNLLPNADYFIDGSAEPVGGQLISFLRIFNMTGEQLEEWSTREDIKDLQLVEYPDCDPALERKTWTFLRNRLQLVLGIYATTLEEDKKLLEDESLINTNKRLAIRMRTTEKKILTNVMNYAIQRISKFQ